MTTLPRENTSQHDLAFLCAMLVAAAFLALAIYPSNYYVVGISFIVVCSSLIYMIAIVNSMSLKVWRLNTALREAIGRLKIIEMGGKDGGKVTLIHGGKIIETKV
jgi:hypothetical protein